MRKLALALAAALSLALSTPTVEIMAAEIVRAGDIAIDQVWSRATAPRVPTGAVYLVLSNNGAEMDRLIAAATPVAEKASLHTILVVDGVIKMRPVDAIEIAPGEPSVLQPGGLHIMLIGLKQPLKQGETVPVILTFEQAGEVEVMSHVQSAGAMNAGVAP